MPCFQYGNTVIDYDIQYEDRKDISISIEWMNGVQVKEPHHLNIRQIEEVLYRKAKWILTKWHQLNEIEDPPAPKEFVSGEKFPYLGRYYRLEKSMLPLKILADSHKCDSSCCNVSFPILISFLSDIFVPLPILAEDGSLFVSKDFHPDLFDLLNRHFIVRAAVFSYLKRLVFIPTA